jgi:putative peptidoglycan lipid II flippase
MEVLLGTRLSVHLPLAAPKGGRSGADERTAESRSRDVPGCDDAPATKYTGTRRGRDAAADGVACPLEWQRQHAPSRRSEAERRTVIEKRDERTTPSIARSTALMSFSTAASRVTGFVRTWAMAVALGVSLASSGAIPVASSFNISNNIPNMVYELLAGGVLSSMFIPIFMERLERDGKQKAHALANSLFGLTFILLGLVALIGTLWPDPFVRTQTFSVSADEASLAMYLFRFFAVQIVFYGWCAITTGVLNSYRKFFAPAIAPLFNNIVVIVVLLGVYLPLKDSRPDIALVALGVGTTLGVVALLVVQIPALLRIGFRFRVGIDLKDPALRKMGRKMLPILGYVGINIVGVSFRNNFATAAFRDGSAALSYAWMWYQLPYGVLAVALITALVPEMASMAARTDWDGFKRTFGKGLRVMSLLILPMAGMLAALSVPLIKLYVAGAFPPDAVPLVAGVLAAWSAALFPFATYMLVLRGFYAMQDSMTPMITNFFIHVLQIVLYWALTAVVAWGPWRLLGIPVADAVCFALHVVVLLVILRKRIGPFDGRHIASTVGRVAVATAFGASMAYAVVRFTPGLAAVRLGFLVQLFAGGVLGLAVTYGLAALFRVTEIADGMALLRRALDRLTPGRSAS